jgi:hypothetical protein
VHSKPHTGQRRRQRGSKLFTDALAARASGILEKDFIGFWGDFGFCPVASQRDEKKFETRYLRTS